MFYNPETFRWEGNENALNAFERPASSPSIASLPANILRERENSTPRPALITNIGATKGFQTVNGMRFDPVNMCWIKEPSSRKSEASDPLDGFNALDDPDDEDVFKDIPDLEDKNKGVAGEEGGSGGRISDVKDDWLVGEEFDVGPAFIKRTQDEEQRWKKKLAAWQPGKHQRRDSWKWTIREIVKATSGH
jgi:hypothetical protein